MASKAPNRGCGCSPIACIGGCVGGSAILGLLLFVAILYLPDIAAKGAKYVLREHTARPMEMPPLRRDPLLLASLNEKVAAFVADVSKAGGREVALTLTEGEINTWLAKEIRAEKGLPLPLHNAHLTLLKGELELRAVLRGKDVLSHIPKSSPEVFRRIVGGMAYINLALRLSLGVRAGRLHFQIRQASLGKIPVPLNAANSVVETFRADRSIQISVEGFRLTNVDIEADRVILRGIAVAEEK